MAHRIDIRLRRPIADDDVHKVRNFIEDVWASSWRRGWVELELLDERVNTMSDFGFAFPARQSHEVMALVSRCVSSHLMESYVEVVHTKKAPADG